MTGENNSTRKLEIRRIPKPDGSMWIDVYLRKFPGAHFIPSFLDLFRMIEAIGDCEDEKYPPPNQGRFRLLAFLRDCVCERDFNVIAQRHQIPERDGDRIVATNGARVRAANPDLPFLKGD